MPAWVWVRLCCSEDASRHMCERGICTMVSLFATNLTHLLLHKVCHNRRWRTFFKTAYIFPQRTQNSAFSNLYSENININLHIFSDKISDAPNQILNVTSSKSQWQRHQLCRPKYAKQKPRTPKKSTKDSKQTPNKITLLFASKNESSTNQNGFLINCLIQNSVII